jgi:virginiamycin B lyase
MRVLVAASSILLSAALLAVPAEHSKPAGNKGKAGAAPLAPKAGVKTPGVQIPFSSLVSEAQISVEAPGWITPAESIFVLDKARGAVVRIDPKTNKTLDAWGGLNQPCSGSVIAFESLWVPNCGSQTLARIDLKTGKTTAAIPTGTTEVTMSLAATRDSIWMLSDSKTSLSRVDPGENKVAGEVRIPANCTSLAFGEGSLWVACPAGPRLLRVNPETNLVEHRIEVSAGARAVAFGDGSVWVLSDKDGKIERIDPKTNKVIKTLDLGTSDAGGNLAFGEGYLWVSQIGFPLTRIETKAGRERVAQQFWGEGGGVVSVSAGAIWLSNSGKGSVSRLDPKRVIATLAE